MMERGVRPSASRPAQAPADTKELEAMAKRAWRERGVIILWPERIKDAWDRQHVLNIASDLYGKR
ncbi:MAG TPA: hypothetical protein VGF43_22630 [Dongiaceae bacterium]|jgi:hypothetical protein